MEYRYTEDCQPEYFCKIRVLILWNERLVERESGVVRTEGDGVAAAAATGTAEDQRRAVRLRSLVERIAALDRRIAATTDISERLALAAERAELARAHALLYQQIREEDLRRQREQECFAGWVKSTSSDLVAAGAFIQFDGMGRVEAWGAYRQAEAAIVEGDWPLAIREARRATVLDPDSRRYVLAYGDAQLGFMLNLESRLEDTAGALNRLLLLREAIRPLRGEFQDSYREELRALASASREQFVASMEAALDGHAALLPQVVDRLPGSFQLVEQAVIQAQGRVQNAQRLLSQVRQTSSMAARNNPFGAIVNMATVTAAESDLRDGCPPNGAKSNDYANSSRLSPARALNRCSMAAICRPRAVTMPSCRSCC